MSIVEVSMVPIGTSTTSVSQYVTKAIRVLRKHEAVTYELTSMGTIIQGELEDIFIAIKAMHESVFDETVRRVYTRIVIDDRRDKSTSIRAKVISVQQKLGD